MYSENNSNGLSWMYILINLLDIIMFCLYHRYIVNANKLILNQSPKVCINAACNRAMKNLQEFYTISKPLAKICWNFFKHAKDSENGRHKRQTSNLQTLGILFTWFIEQLPLTDCKFFPPLFDSFLSTYGHILKRVHIRLRAQVKA